MKNHTNLGYKIIFIGIIVMLWSTLFLWLGRMYDTIDFWGIMLIGAALITFFGFLQMPGCIDENGSFRESRIRLTITATLVVAYLVYFGSIVYLEPVEVDGRVIESYAKDLLPTLTNLLMVSISFYFGSTAAIEIADSFSKKKEKQNKRG